MEIVGDLERGFAAWVYPNRVLVGLAVAIGIAGLALLARRRRWDAAARRHPARTLAVLALGLAVLGPLGWYLGSPLFLTATIDEPAPAAAAQQGSAQQESPSPSVPGAPDPRQRSGIFTGADEFHFGKGTARLIETATGSFTLRLEDFAVRNGPDLYVYLSPSAEGYAPGAIELGRLKADRGNQNYDVPAGTDVSSARSVVIWCRQFSVLFATAPLG